MFLDIFPIYSKVCCVKSVISEIYVIVSSFVYLSESMQPADFLMLQTLYIIILLTTYVHKFLYALT
jgi:hypothetical protein